MDDNVRWTVRVSSDIDETVRAYLGRRGGTGRALSRLIEEALRAQIFEKSVERIKRRTSCIPHRRLQRIVREAVQYARRTR